MMVRQASGLSVSSYVHAVKQHFDDLNECLQLKDGSAAIHPHVLALVMIRGLSNVGQYGQAKQCVSNAFDTDCILSADRVMGSIIFTKRKIWTQMTLLPLTILSPDIPSMRFLLTASAHVVAVFEAGLLINAQTYPSFP
jgi:hypothetical protein